MAGTIPRSQKSQLILKKTPLFEMNRLYVVSQRVFCTFHPKVLKPKIPKAKIVKVENTQGRNTQCPKITMAKIPKIETTIPIN